MQSTIFFSLPKSKKNQVSVYLKEVTPNTNLKENLNYFDLFHTILKSYTIGFYYYYYYLVIRCVCESVYKKIFFFFL